MKLWLVLLCGCLGTWVWSGCSKRPTQEAERLAQCEAQIRKIEETRLAVQRDLEARTESRISELRQQVQSMDLRKTRAMDSLEFQVSAGAKELADLQSAIRRMSADLRAMEARLAAASADVKTEPARALEGDREQPGMFALRVSSVAGKKVITGRHTSAVMAPTAKFERDSLGNKVRVFEPKDEEVSEYGYQVEFVLENPAASAREAVVNAGETTMTFHLPPGCVMSNLSVSSSMGANLMVTSSGISKSFPVSYSADATVGGSP